MAIGSAVLAATLMHFVVGFDGLCAQDGYEYLRYTQALKTYLITGDDPGDYFWPVGYPLLGALFSFIVQDISFSLQLISALSLALTFVYSFNIIRFLFPGTRRSSTIWFCILFVALSPFLLRFAFMVMSDMLTLACITISSFYFLKAGRFGTTSALLLGSFFGALAGMTRYAAVVILVPVAVYGYWLFLRNSKYGFNALIAVIAGLLPVIPHFLIRGSASGDFIQHNWISHWSIITYFKNDLYTGDGGHEYHRLPNIVYALGGLFHPRYCFAAAPILILGFKKIKLTKELLPLITGLILYLFFIAGIPHQNNRYLLLALPFFVFIFYFPWQHLVTGKNWVYTTTILGIIVIQGILFPFAFKAVYTRNQLEKQVYNYLEAHHNPDVYTMDIDVSLTGRGYPGKIHNIYTHYYPAPDTNALVIFNALTMPFQWSQMNPMKNWQHFNHDYQLKEIKRFNNGWAVHQFE